MTTHTLNHCKLQSCIFAVCACSPNWFTVFPKWTFGLRELGMLMETEHWQTSLSKLMPCSGLPKIWNLLFEPCQDFLLLFFSHPPVFRTKKKANKDFNPVNRDMSQSTSRIWILSPLRSAAAVWKANAIGSVSKCRLVTYWFLECVNETKDFLRDRKNSPLTLY